MEQVQELRRAADSIAEHQGPVFSAYLSVNAALPENQERAYLPRLRNALEEQEVPKKLARRIREHLESETHPRARTLAIFAAEDGLFEVYRVQLEIPESFRWGDPYVAPLVLALEDNEPYGAVVLDAERFRYFVVSAVHTHADDREIKGHGYRELDLHPNRPYPRGGRDYEPVSRRTEANVSHFYNELGERTRELIFRAGVRHLILAGPKERTSEFRERLPEEVRERVVAEEHVALGAPEGEILERLEEFRRKAEYEQERELLEEARESGVRGLDDILKALQEENRVHHLLLLWEMDGEIRWSDEDGLAIPDITKEESPYSGAGTRVRPLIDVLLDLAAARGARVTFYRGENKNADTLREELGGVAGLTRF
jgi:peptide subunit release factor 1 (eRF1)